MSALDAWQAEQHEDQLLQSDHAFTAYLAGLTLHTVAADYEPAGLTERQMLANHPLRRTA